MTPARALERAAFLAALAAFRIRNQWRDLRERTRFISIFSSPRGGSTWLAETLMQIPRSVVLYEPLIPQGYRRIRELNLGWDPHIPEGSVWPEGERFFSDLFGGRITPVGRYAKNRWDALLRPRLTIVKMVRGNLCLPWLLEHFEDLNPVLLVRHPCAVVASQLRHPGWSWVHEQRAFHRPEGLHAQEIYGPHAAVLAQLRKPEEFLAARWAIFTAYLLRHRDHNRRWHTVAYESLYRDPQGELERLWAWLDFNPGAGLDAGRVSRSTLGSSPARILKGDQLEHWREALSADSVSRIMDTVTRLGVHCYHAQRAEPDYDQLYAAAPPLTDNRHPGATG